jgi:hypothetical protein
MLAPGGNVIKNPGTRRKNKYAVVKISYIYILCVKIMEDSDRRMLLDMFEPLLANGPLVMKKEYRKNFAYRLTEEIPELFPDVRIIEDPREGIYFKGPKTRLFFPSGRDFVDILISNFNSRDHVWDYMPFLRHKEIEKKVMNILREIYREKGQGVRNAQLLGLYKKIPHGVESEIASMLSGIEGKNAYQQGDILKEQAGIQGPHPNRKKFSGRRKTLRRKNLRSSRKR